MLKFLNFFFDVSFSQCVCVLVVRIIVFVVMVVFELSCVVKGCLDRFSVVIVLMKMWVFMVWVWVFILIIRLGFWILVLLGQFLILVVMVSWLFGCVFWISIGDSMVWLVQIVVVQFVGFELMISICVWLGRVELLMEVWDMGLDFLCFDCQVIIFVLFCNLLVIVCKGGNNIV